MDPHTIESSISCLSSVYWKLLSHYGCPRVILRSDILTTQCVGDKDLMDILYISNSAILSFREICRSRGPPEQHEFADGRN